MDGVSCSMPLWLRAIKKHQVSKREGSCVDGMPWDGAPPTPEPVLHFTVWTQPGSSSSVMQGNQHPAGLGPGDGCPSAAHQQGGREGKALKLVLLRHERSCRDQTLPGSCEMGYGLCQH